MTARSNVNYGGYRSHSGYKDQQKQWALAITQYLSMSPALNSINLGVKYNDLSYISGRDLNKLRKQPEVGDDLQYQSAHHNLSGVRKNYDSMHQKKQFRETSITKLKEEKKKLQIIEGQLLDNKQTGRKKVDNMNNKLTEIKYMFNEVDMGKKVLDNMRNRLKTDKVVYDSRKFNLEKQLNFLKKQKDVIILDKNQVSQSDGRSVQIYKKYLAQLKEQQNQRDQHIRSLQSMIESKQNVGQLNLNRSQQMQDIAERAMQDKDQNQKNWEKICLTNKFLARMLREKMDKEMNKFFVVESAFKTIKIATGVNDAQTLVRKFLSKQTTYGDLLGKIADNQKRIVQLKQQSEQLRIEHKQLETERQILVNTKIQSVEVDQEIKTLNQIEKKQKISILQREKFRSWLIKTVRKMNIGLSKNHEITNQRTLKGISQNFVSYLKYLSSVIDEMEKNEQKVNEKFQPDQKIRNEKKLLRVQLRKNEGVFEQESQDQINLNNEEGDLLYGQRNQIHRNNQKFMKEAKRKFEQVRKQKAQQASPKKKEVEVKPKQPELELL